MKKLSALLFIFISFTVITGFVWHVKQDKKISINELNNTLKKNEKTLLYFSAKWCLICPKLKPAIDEIEAEKTAGFNVVKIDTDRDREIAEEFEITSLPVIMVYRNEKREWIHVGLIDKGELKIKLESY